MEQDCTIIALTEPSLIKDNSPPPIMRMDIYEFTGNIYFSQKLPHYDCRFEAIRDVVPDINKIHENTTFDATVKFENGKYSLLSIYFIHPNP